MTRAFIIANGPSLTQADVDMCRGQGMVYAVKEAMHMAPWADVLYCADIEWWQIVRGAKEFEGERWSCAPNCWDMFGVYAVQVLPLGDCFAPWSEQQGVVANGGNSGFQAMNLAYLQGATEIILLGFDYGTEGGPKKHWFDDIDELKRVSWWSDFALWQDLARKAAPLIKVPVINCTRGGQLDAFPRADLADILR